MILRLIRCIAIVLVALQAAHAADELPLPDDAELEASGARIGEIAIAVDDVFEARPGKEWNSLYQFVNWAHPTTDSETIRQQLLFRSGDPYLQRNLDETARILRSRRYFHDARVVPVRRNADNTVDVEVRVHDVWTLVPAASYGRSGGTNRSSVGLKDTNFLGWGKALSFARTSNVDRTSWLFNYNDQNLFGSWWHLVLDYADSSDGYQHGLALKMPFYALRTPWSLGLAASDGVSTLSRYNQGLIVDQFEVDRNAFSVDAGIQRNASDEWVSRYLGGFRYERNQFTAPAQGLVGPLPGDRTLSYPYAGIEWLEDSYHVTSNLNQIGRTEDLHLGRSLSLTAGLSAPAFGAERTSVILGGTAGAGIGLGNNRYLLGDITYSGRMENGSLADSRLGLETSFYLRHSNWSVFYASLSGESGSRLDPDHQILLGGDSGLRGYPLRYLAGSSRALLTLEERFYSNWRPFELFQVGGAVFFDAGRVWGTDPVATESRGVLKDVGIGLRFGSLRSGLGNVIHVDYAIPLDRRPGMDGAQLVIETRRSF